MEIKCCALAAQRFDVRGNWNGLDAIGIVRVLDAKRTHFGAFAQHRIAAHHHVFVDEGFVAPLLHTGVNLECFAIGGRTTELGVDFQQGGANDACGFDQLAPRLNAALHEEVERRRVHPFGKVREKDDACGIAVTEHHLHFINNCFAHQKLSCN
jgi:hypothetical protein